MVAELKPRGVPQLQRAKITLSTLCHLRGCREAPDVCLASRQVCTETFGAAPEVVIHSGAAAMATMPYVDSHLVRATCKSRPSRSDQPQSCMLTCRHSSPRSVAGAPPFWGLGFKVFS